jgi:transcriptional regulator
MYIPRLFHESNWPEIKMVIEQNSFATVISCNAGVPVATHVPLRLVEAADGTAKLQGHMSKANQHWRLFEEQPEHQQSEHQQSEHLRRALAIFMGGDAYVSPRWYDHVNVPTWNYIAVHVYGRPRLVTDAAEMHEMMRGLVDRYEGNIEGNIEEAASAPAEGGRRYTLDGLPPDFLAGQMKGIVGFEILVDEVQASFKLSQNRDQKNYENVVAQLRKSDDQKAQNIAEVMSNRRRPQPE